ncbi:MAG: hypothetical protein IPM97_01455 [Bdellovibrionaceae bacterium]|nr:hypothetical protein [Pseudobdellovibrionaceae bacterium]
MVSKALIYGDVELKSAMAFVIHDAHSAYDFIQLHPLLTPPAQKEFILILKNLAGQDRSQWGPYAAGAERALLQLSAQADKKNSVTCEGVFK